MPRTFTRGLLYHLLYALALVFVSYFLFKKSLFRLNEDKNKQLAPGETRSSTSSKTKNLALNPGEYQVARNLFSGKTPGQKKKVKKFNGKISIAERDIAANPLPLDFQYLCRPGSLPGDIRVIDFLCLALSLLNQPREQKQKSLKGLELSGFKHKFELR